MAVDVKQYIDQLAQTAGLTQEEKDAILKVSGNEKFAKALGDDILRQQDYSRNMDALKADRTKWEGWYKDTLAATNNNQKVVDDYAARLKAYEATFGPIDDGNGGRQQFQQVQDVISKKDFEAELAKRDSQTISLLKDGMYLASAHSNEFHEALDTDMLAKIAVEKSMTLRQAYDDMVAPRRTEAQKVAHAAELKKAGEDAVRDFASKNRIPVDTQPREYHTLLDRDPSKQVGVGEYVPNSGQLSPQATRQLRSNFAETWNEAAGGGTSGT